MTAHELLAKWLNDNGLGRHLASFTSNDIELDLIGELDDQDLRELGLSLGDRKRFFRAVAATTGNTAEASNTRPFGWPAPQATTTAPTQAHRRQLTVMFCDLVGSTQLAERMDPEDLRQLTHGYQNLAGEIVETYEGSIARLLGDGILAYFGFPQAHEDDAERGVLAALDLIERVPQLPGAHGHEPLQVRIGIATGLVVVADLDAEDVFTQGDVFGETPNLAARLQGLAHPNTIVIATRTHQLVGARFEYDDLGRHELKGFSEPVKAWRVVTHRRGGTPFDNSDADQLTTLVGRERELTAIDGLWQQARQGHGRAVVLRGEAGIGKSRLVRAVWEAADRSEHFRVLNQCSPFTTHSALAPMIRELERRADIQPGDDDEQRLHQLGTLHTLADPDSGDALDILARLLAIGSAQAAATTLSAEQLKERTLEVLIERLLFLASRGPVLYLIEDAHWIDPSSQELLRRLIPRIADHRLLLLVAARPEFTPDWEPQAQLSRIDLDRLNTEQGLAMIRQITGNLELPPEVCARVLNRADGNPLFVEEITRLVLESGLLEQRGNRYLLQGSLADLAIPETLQDSLMARIDRLSMAREVAQIGATLGRDFSHALISRVADLPAQQLADELTRLVDAGLLFRRDNGADGNYQFRHALIQEAAYQSLLKSRRRHIHQRVFEVLERQLAQGLDHPPELLAHHCTGAGLVERAIPYWQSAGDAALAQSAHAEAIGHLKTGKNLLQELPAGPARDTLELKLLLSLGIALTATHGYGVPEVRESYSRAAVLALQLSQSEQLFPALYGLWWGTLLQADYDHARELGETLLAQAEAGQSPAYQVSAHRALGATLFYNGDLQAARAQFERALAIPARADYRRQVMLFDVVDPWVVCRCYHAGTLWLLGDEQAALRESGRSIAMATELDHPFTLALTQSFAAWLHQFRNDRARAHHHAAEALILARRHGFVFWIGWSTIIGSWADPDPKDPRARITGMNRGVRDWEGAGASLGLNYFRALLADAQCNSDDFAPALNNLTQAREGALKSHELWWVPEMYRLEGDLLLGQNPDQPGPAITAYRRAIDLAEQQHSLSLATRALVSLARLHQLQGDHAAARTALDIALAYDVSGNTERYAAEGLLTALSAPCAQQ